MICVKAESPRYLRPKSLCTIPVSFTHLDVYKRQVMTFYGWVAVMTTYYLLTGSVTTQRFLVATAMGAVAVNILVVNNYRCV